MKGKIFGKSRRFLRVAGIAAEEEQSICFGIVEGETPCFVYRRKPEDLDRERLPFPNIILDGEIVYYGDGDEDALFALL